MKVREYLAAGLPVAANNSGDALDFKEYISIVDNAQDYQAVLEKIMAGDQALKTIAGRKFLEDHLDWTRLGTVLESILNPE